jgi:hypothetical protein
MQKTPRILICVPCHNRKAIAAQCLPTIANGASWMDYITLWNDGSSEYHDDFLKQFGDEVKHPHYPEGYRMDAVGIEEQRRKHFLSFNRNWEEFTHLYLTDADALHDPHWRTQALYLSDELEGAPVCLYNTQAHARLAGNTIEDMPNFPYLLRRVAPGISYFLTAAHVKKVVAALPALPPHWNWDWSVPSILGGRFVISRTSFVDHIGLGGYHHPPHEGLDGGDRATDPTPWLVDKRAEVVKELQNAAF